MQDKEFSCGSRLISIADVKCQNGIFIIPTGAIEPNDVYYEFYTREELKRMSKEDLKEAQERVDAMYRFNEADDYRTYEKEKKRLRDQNLSHKEYEQALREIAKKLGI